LRAGDSAELVAQQGSGGSTGAMRVASYSRKPARQRSFTTNTTLNAADFGRLIRVDGSAGAFTVTLPDATLSYGSETIFFKRTDSSANTVTVTAASGQTIDGGASVTLTGQWQALRLMSDGADWLEV